MVAHGSKKPVGRSAFTLVELLVVIAIIAILLSLLVPSFRRFREHARVVACQSYMGSIGKGLLNYALDLDTFPITSDSRGNPISWRYGGWTGSNARFWKNRFSGAFHIPTPERPLSAYMFRDLGLRESTRLPAFRCPSERLSQRAALGIGADETPAYEDIGTSYHLNWQWFESQTLLPGAPYSQNRWVHRVPRGERIWWKYMQRNASRFVTLLEDPADYALRHRERVVGNHVKFSKHNFAFLDGHAEYLQADTRHLRESGWTVIDEDPPYKEWWVD
ncbi:MAG: type II secretion system protein [bacterium]|nr:type II secretion system protein [bacterium]